MKNINQRSFYNFELDTVCLDYTEYYDEGELDTVCLDYTEYYDEGELVLAIK